jgi:hypothetical protein
MTDNRPAGRLLWTDSLLLALSALSYPTSLGFTQEAGQWSNLPRNLVAQVVLRLKIPPAGRNDTVCEVNLS